MRENALCGGASEVHLSSCFLELEGVGELALVQGEAGLEVRGQDLHRNINIENEKNKINAMI